MVKTLLKKNQMKKRKMVLMMKTLLLSLIKFFVVGGDTLARFVLKRGSSLVFLVFGVSVFWCLFFFFSQPMKNHD